MNHARNADLKKIKKNRKHQILLLGCLHSFSLMEVWFPLPIKICSPNFYKTHATLFDFLWSFTTPPFGKWGKVGDTMAIIDSFKF